jgi:hypothetical protein
MVVQKYASIFTLEIKDALNGDESTELDWHSLVKTPLLSKHLSKSLHIYKFIYACIKN